MILGFRSAYHISVQDSCFCCLEYCSFIIPIIRLLLDYYLFTDLLICYIPYFWTGFSLLQDPWISFCISHFWTGFLQMLQLIMPLHHTCRMKEGYYWLSALLIDIHTKFLDRIYASAGFWVLLLHYTCRMKECCSFCLLHY